MARKKRGKRINGWVIIDKPVNIGSTQVVGKVRRIFDAQKAGHAGTLDPLATGILPIALGEATKTMPFITDGAKGYRFSIRWGAETDTCDLEGKVTGSSDHRPTQAQAMDALATFTGSIDQTPPIYSAIKVDGERAYDLARRGEAVELKSREVEIHDFRVVEWREEGDATFEISCGSGTYVRSLARDFARHLGTFGHVSQLRRTFVGRFDETRAISLEKLEALGHGARAFEHLFPVQTALDDIPALAVTGEETARIRRGQEVVAVGRALTGPLSGGSIPEVLSNRSSFETVWAKTGKADDVDPVALGNITGGRFRPTRVFNLDTDT